MQWTRPVFSDVTSESDRIVLVLLEGGSGQKLHAWIPFLPNSPFPSHPFLLPQYSAFIVTGQQNLDASLEH